MASMAASLMCCGVAKCGSPAPKSARSMPCDFIFRASAVIAIVAETSMRLIRSVRILVGAATVAVLMISVYRFAPAERSGSALCPPASTEVRRDCYCTGVGSHGDELTFGPLMVEQPLDVGPREHPHQFSLASTLPPALRFSIPTFLPFRLFR